MALSVIKKGGINSDGDFGKRPALTPAFKHFEEIDSQTWMNEILDEILKEVQ